MPAVTLHWVVGNEPIALDQLKDRYYEPGLLAKILGFNEEPLRDVQAFTAPRLYPAVKLSHQDRQLRIKLTDRGGGIGKVVVMVRPRCARSACRGSCASRSNERIAADNRLSKTLGRFRRTGAL